MADKKSQSQSQRKYYVFLDTHQPIARLDVISSNGNTAKQHHGSNEGIDSNIPLNMPIVNATHISSELYPTRPSELVDCLIQIVSDSP